MFDYLTANATEFCRIVIGAALVLLLVLVFDLVVIRRIKGDKW